LPTLRTVIYGKIILTNLHGLIYFNVFS